MWCPRKYQLGKRSWCNLAALLALSLAAPYAICKCTSAISSSDKRAMMFTLCRGVNWFITSKTTSVARFKGHISFTIYIFEIRKCEIIGREVKPVNLSIWKTMKFETYWDSWYSWKSIYFGCHYVMSKSLHSRSESYSSILVSEFAYNKCDL